METSIPFQGFYNSIHDSNLDYGVEQMFTDRESGSNRNGGLEAKLHWDCDWSKVHLAYATEYAECFAWEFKLPSLKMTELQSPKEYNFTTDRIFCDISEADVIFLRSNTDECGLRELAREKFTSRSGFYSYYDPDIDNWGPLLEWDLNQVGTLVEAYVNQETNSSDGFDGWAEHSLMENAFGNNFIEDIVGDATPNIERLYKIHDYLETRAAR